MGKRTDTGEKVLDTIIAYQRQHERPPTVREIAQALDMASTGGIHRWLEILRSQGKIEWEPGKSRTIRVIQKKGE